MRCLIAGNGSDIAAGLKENLERDGWHVSGVSGHSITVPMGRWDLLILAHGKLDPIDRFFECDMFEWMGSVMVNAIYPLTCLRAAWPNRNPGAKVVFIGGPNMTKPSPTYTAYRAGKAILESLADTLGIEYPEHKFVVLHPGVVRTKIHEQTIKAGRKAANYERVMNIHSGKETGNSYAMVYEKLKALL